MNFSDLGLSEKTIQAIDEFGIKEPTTVQTDVIPSILQGKDVFTIAPAGCGKTMSYVFPLIDIISSNNSDKGSSGKNILIVTPDSAQSVKVSDRLAVFTNITKSTKRQLRTVTKTSTTKPMSSSVRRTCCWTLPPKAVSTCPKPIFWS